MPEIKRQPILGYKIDVIPDDGDTVFFGPEHTHSDILRYVISDVGAEHAEALMAQLCREADNGR